MPPELPLGVDRRPNGSLRARVSVGPRTHTLRASRVFPAGTSSSDLKLWRAATMARLSAQLPLAVQSGTLAADVQTYLDALPVQSDEDRSYRRGQSLLLAHWVRAHGARRTLDLTRADVEGQLTAWRQVKTPSTCNHRLSALANLFRVRYPSLQPPPTMGVRRFREAESHIPQLTREDVREILDTMAWSRARCHLEVFNATGFSPVRVKRLTPADVNLLEGVVWMERRRKGKGTKSRTYLLSDEGKWAFEAMTTHHAWGTISGTTLRTTWERAIERANAQRRADGRTDLLPVETVYSIRHVFGAHLYRLTRDIKATADLMDIDPKTAVRYTRQAVSAVMQSTVEALNRVAVKRPTVVPFDAVKMA